jgi:hypothetical protein
MNETFQIVNTSATNMSEVFNVECFINATEDWPPPWDSRCTDYANHLKKQECCNKVCRQLMDDFDALSTAVVLKSLVL